MILEWFLPAPKLRLEWMGPDAKTLQEAYDRGTSSLAAIIGLPGPAGTIIHVSETPPDSPSLNQLWLDIS